MQNLLIMWTSFILNYAAVASKKLFRIPVWQCLMPFTLGLNPLNEL